jgi:hypothetical protein
LVHPLYDISKVAVEITNQESEFCAFDTTGFMTIYPKYDISKFETGNADTIYTVKDRRTGEQFIFAIRSCALPPGF